MYFCIFFSVGGCCKVLNGIDMGTESKATGIRRIAQYNVDLVCDEVKSRMF